MSLYYLIKKKNIFLSILFLGFATMIKYFSVLLLPFIIICYYKDNNTKDRLKKCILYGFIFLLILCIPYLIYIKDMSVLNGMITQQGKIAKNFYVILLQYFNNIPDLVSKLNKILLYSFIIIYFFTCLVMLYNKKIVFRKEMRKYFVLVMFFLFLLITQFQPWYIMWLFPCIIWQRSKDIKLIIQISLISQLANIVFLINGEGWIYGTQFTLVMLLGIIICIFLNNRKRIINKILGG